jgi:hypothetical protein
MKNFELNSIIINGIRFDAVKDKGASCYECSLFFNDECTLQGGGRVCRSLIGSVMVFKKSDKQFEL